MRSVLSTIAVLATVVAFTFGFLRAHTAPAELNSQGLIQDESVEVQLARAHVSLAKLALRQALEANRRQAGVYSDEFIDKLKLHVEIDEAHLQQCLKGDDFDPHQICIANAEASVKLAEAELNRATGVHRRAPTPNTALNVDRTRILLEIAKLNLTRTRNLEASESVVQHLQAQIDQLRHQVLQLQLLR